LGLQAQSDSAFRRDTAAARRLLLQGQDLRDMGNYSQALDKDLQALKIMESLKKDHLRGMCWLHLASVYHEMVGTSNTEVYVDKGIAYGRLAYDFFVDTHDTIGLSRSLNMLGVLFRDKARNFDHLWYYDTAFVDYKTAIHLLDLSGLGANQREQLYNNISQVYLEYKNDPRSALEYLFKALDLDVAARDTNGLTYNYGNISHAYERESNFPLAIDYARKMLRASQDLRQPQRVQNSYFQIFNVYESFGKFDSALRYHILASDLNDSLTDIEKTQQVAELQTRFETVKREAEIGTLKTERSNQNKEILSLLVAALVFAVLAVSMVILYRRVRRQRQQIAEQSARLEVMMKELHHRVKNNLQVVSSLLSLQSYDLMDERAIAALKESQQRVEAMSLIHQRLYKKDALTSVNMREYLSDLAESLLASYGFERDTFELDISVHPEMLDVDKALPLGLIVNEMVTNALKYAYPSVARPALWIRLSEDNRQLVCQIGDNGVGIDVHLWKQKTHSFGKQLIAALCRQLRAEQTLAVDGGTQFTLIIPKQAA
jgi:two-component sensor histidine kinase